ncbi:iron(III) transport system ATP-binding protein [Hydrogenispora ethanolica]|uniref:Spermidine/putrescine import ATP-binding protein PotA n=1 Tax=Hydrogenispora ethanolica TaxID=1082276 RepID=A0A4R1RGY5_HYDET|nr:ABC transporter ATP-binding protein [Hydrogenispora ethanolica]TCL65318.1 iron(III) transport system ATP-binding protein [Hydrogenispora ethanolica]
MSYDVNIARVVKKYGQFKAVDGVSVGIKKGELFTLLGPSGCGKTTLLRMIAGFNSIDEGEISFDQTVINDIPAHKRNIGMVFQNYAIFPHMSVFENVAYGLKARKLGSAEIAKRVEEALDLVQIGNFRDRQPAQLSGGQQQRVALARAVVIHPGILLMDEPLSNLDAKLRIQMRSVIKKLQRSLNITTIYVTHDQEEALAISDRIAVMRNGRIEQLDGPQQIYEQPANAFVAGFIGTSNFLAATLLRQDSAQGAEVLIAGKKKLVLPLKRPVGKEAVVSVRPEALELGEPAADELNGEIILATFLGDYINYEVALDNGQSIEVNEFAKETLRVREAGEKVAVRFQPAKIHLFEGTVKEASA